LTSGTRPSLVARRRQKASGSCRRWSLLVRDRRTRPRRLPAGPPRWPARPGRGGFHSCPPDAHSAAPRQQASPQPPPAGESSRPELLLTAKQKKANAATVPVVIRRTGSARSSGADEHHTHRVGTGSRDQHGRRTGEQPKPHGRHPDVGLGGCPIPPPPRPGTVAPGGGSPTRRPRLRQAHWPAIGAEVRTDTTTSWIAWLTAAASRGSASRDSCVAPATTRARCWSTGRPSCPATPSTPASCRARRSGQLAASRQGRPVPRPRSPSVPRRRTRRRNCPCSPAVAELARASSRDCGGRLE
jgi:hypothetical protein